MGDKFRRGVNPKWGGRGGKPSFGGKVTKMVEAMKSKAQAIYKARGKNIKGDQTADAEEPCERRGCAVACWARLRSEG